MTGYGTATYKDTHTAIRIDVKSVNSKNNDLYLRLPLIIREKENEIRVLANEKLNRGKAEINISIESQAEINTNFLNKPLIKSLLYELDEIITQEQLSKSQLLAAILTLPEVRTNQQPTADESLMQLVMQTLGRAFEDLDTFRLHEGNKMMEDIVHSIDKIRNHIQYIKTIETQRIPAIKDRILQKINALQQDILADNNRIEQELIYYIEKLDINEELVRMDAHLGYFMDISLDKKPNMKGKKLSFVAQEMLREVNTIGSKANDADLQRFVVECKDEIEKIKELLNNIL